MSTLRHRPQTPHSTGIANARRSSQHRSGIEKSEPMPMLSYRDVQTQTRIPRIGSESYERWRDPEYQYPEPALPQSRPGNSVLRQKTAHDDAYTETNNSRMSTGPSIVPSAMSTNPSKASLTPRHSSGFKATIRRIFGSRKRSSLPGVRPSYHLSVSDCILFPIFCDLLSFYKDRNHVASDPVNQACNHASDQFNGNFTDLMQDPGNLIGPVSERPEGETVAQAPYEPQSRVTRTSALSSNPPSSIDIVKPSRWEPPSDWKTLFPQRRRRNTLPSIVLSQQEAQLIARALDQKIASSDQQIARYSVQSTNETPTVLKRRSRSADALNELAGTLTNQDSRSRDREDEIAYWKHAADQEQTYVGQLAPSPTATAIKRLTREALTPTQAVGPSEQEFDFSLPGGTNDSVSLEQRVSTLEIKVVDFEYAIANLQGTVAEPHASTKTGQRRSIHDLFPDAQFYSGSNPHTSYSETFLCSPSTSPVRKTKTEFPTQRLRLSRSDTIRPSTAQPHSRPRQSDRNAPLTTHSNHSFEVIIQLVREEQAARQRLEGQVQALQKEVDDLRAPVYAYIRPAAIPTPSPESKYRTPVAPKARTLHRAPAFGANTKAPMTVTETSRFSTTDDGSALSGTDDGDGFQDVYESPEDKRSTFESSRSYLSP